MNNRTHRTRTASQTALRDTHRVWAFSALLLACLLASVALSGVRAGLLHVLIDGATLAAFVALVGAMALPVRRAWNAARLARAQSAQAATEQDEGAHA